MQYTEKLNLPILEGTDSMANLATQGNAIANQLESVVGANIENIEAVPELFNTVEEQGNDIEALEGRVEILEDLQTKETVSIGGVSRQLTKHIVKAEVTMNGSYNAVYFKAVNDDDDHRHCISITKGYVYVNMTELLGVENATDILIKNVITYQNGLQYMDTKNALPMDVCFLGKLPNSNDLTLGLLGDSSSLYQQTRSVIGGSEIWNPSTGSQFSTNQSVIVVLEYFDLT